jgi:hypothetical protein
MDQRLREFDREIGEARESEAAWAALCRLASAIAGHRLFTVMTVDIDAGLARRAFSDHPAEYPVTGTKPIQRDAWFDIVHSQRRSFIANTIEDIASVFPDFELIRSLGCGSVVNLPVVLGDELAATINLLHAEHFYTPERVAALESQLALPAKLCCAQAARFDAQGACARGGKGLIK